MDKSTHQIASLAPYNWNISLDKQFATFDTRISEIYPVQGDTAVMVTNSFANVPVDKWMVFSRKMLTIAGEVHTSMKLLGTSDMLAYARDIGREYAWLEFGVDISIYDLPF